MKGRRGSVGEYYTPVDCESSYKAGISHDGMTCDLRSLNRRPKFYLHVFQSVSLQRVAKRTCKAAARTVHVVHEMVA